MLERSLYKSLFFMMFITLSACANELELVNDSQLQDAISKVSYEPNWFSMIFGLITVVLLIYLTGFIYQKMIGIKLTNTNFDDFKLNILSTTSLGQGKNLHVVNIGNKNILIGSTQSNITYITDVDMLKKGGDDNG